MKRSYYLVTTDHLEEQIWFRDDADFKTGMNHVAATTAESGMDVLAFILMSNHVHFVLSCSSRDEALLFINAFKHRYSIYYHCRHGIRKALNDNAVDIREIGLKPESLEKAVAYVVMNCVAARICTFANDYRWGSGSCYFRHTPVGGKPVAAFSARKRYALLSSKTTIPSEWQITEEGYILPDSYVQVTGVERLFRTPGRLSYFLNHSSKAKAVLDSGITNLPSFKDQTLVALVQDLCQSLYHQSSPKSISDEEKKDLLHQLRRRTGSDPKQLMRVLGLSYETVVDWLE